MSDQPYCDLYGCYRAKKPGATQNVTVDGQDYILEICYYHWDLFNVMTPSMYTMGRTYNGEIEFRFIPAVPAAVPQPFPLSRGTVFLKASGTDVPMISMSENDATFLDGRRNDVFVWEIDERLQGDNPIPSWFTPVESGGWILSAGAYVAQTCGRGILTYDDVPSHAGVSLYGINAGVTWDSNGTLDSPPIELAASMELPFLQADSDVGWHATDLLLSAGGYNNGDTTGNPRITAELRHCLTKIAAAPAYVEADII
jgi:hypothetical protein